MTSQDPEIIMASQEAPIVQDDSELRSLVDICSEPIVVAHQDELKQLLPPVRLSHLSIFWTNPGPLSFEDILNALPKEKHWLGKLFLNWLEREYGQENKISGLLDKKGVLNLGGLLVSSSFPSNLELEKYRPGDLKDLGIPTDSLIAAYFHNSMLITPKDLHQIGEFIQNFQKCRLLSLAYNRIGFRQKEEEITAEIFFLLSLHNNDNSMLIDLTGNPCISVEYSKGGRLFSTITADQIKMLQFLPQSFFGGGEWRSLFTNNTDKLEVITAVERCHNWIFNGGAHP